MIRVLRLPLSSVSVALCSVVLTTAGCQADPEAAGSGLTITVDTVGDIVRVSNTGTAPAWRLTPVVSVGPKSLTDEGSPDEIGSVSSASLGPDGALFVADALRVIGRVLASEPISDEEWENGNEEFREFVATTPDADCEPRRPIRPDTKPFIAQIFIASDGKLWVEVVRTAGNRWEVFGPEGRLLATLPVREWKARSVPAFGPDHMVTIRQDSLEIDYVDVWRIDIGIN